MSFVIECQTLDEIDYYWEKLGAGGRYDQCDWLETTIVGRLSISQNRNINAVVFG